MKVFMKAFTNDIFAHGFVVILITVAIPITQNFEK